MFDFRVLYQYLDNEGNPRFEFTTVLAPTAADAQRQLERMHESDFGLVVVQVVESNGASTGYLPADSAEAIAHAAQLRASHERD
ncbi:MAG: hypothetical protein JWP85_2142 [Rhodoglobus sp.]|nr:hypothetical protein [Rhodoglobus sp.]